jgi:hypothetical protein
MNEFNKQEVQISYRKITFFMMGVSIWVRLTLYLVASSSLKFLLVTRRWRRIIQENKQSQSTPQQTTFEISPKCGSVEYPNKTTGATICGISSKQGIRLRVRKKAKGLCVLPLITISCGHLSEMDIPIL